MTPAAVRAAFRRQSRACADMGSAQTARLLAGLADELTHGNPVADRILGWAGNPGPEGASVPLRLAGALHALVLTGADGALARAYADAGQDPLPAALAAIERHGETILRWLDNPPQTNEVGRSAVLIAAGHALTQRFGLPLVLSELGASAGLNLIWDRYALRAGVLRLGPVNPVLTLAPIWRGDLPPVARPRVAGRAAVDLRPLDPAADRIRLLAYVWADQQDRLDRTRRAAEAAAAAGARVDAGDAVDWLAGRLRQRHAGHLHLVFHTVVWQYLPAAAKARGAELFALAGTIATPEAPLARLAMEGDGDPGGARLTLELWPDGRQLDLGRCDFHGRWVDWRNPWPSTARAANL